MGSSPLASRYRLVWLKGRLPKKPLDAENGLGWGASKIRCLGLCSMDFFILAGRPQRINRMNGRMNERQSG